MMQKTKSQNTCIPLFQRLFKYQMLLQQKLYMQYTKKPTKNIWLYAVCSALDTRNIYKKTKLL